MKAKRTLTGLPESLFDSASFTFEGALPVLSSTSTSHALNQVNAPPNDASAVSSNQVSVPQGRDRGAPAPTRGLTCGLCGESFADVSDQRSHFKSDWHKFNVKRRSRSRGPLTAEQFALRADRGPQQPQQQPAEQQHAGGGGTAGVSAPGSLEDDDLSSLSGSGSEGEGEEAAEERREATGGSASSGPRVVFFLPRTQQLFSVWRALLSKKALEAAAEGDSRLLLAELRALEQPPPAAAPVASLPVSAPAGMPSPAPAPAPPPSPAPRLWAVLLSSGGHFAGAVFDAAHGGRLVAHQTVHRYVVRAKAGGRQSSQDATGRAPHSAGASLRRHNEAALTRDIRDLLCRWLPLLSSAQLIFIHAPGANRAALFGTAADHSRCVFPTASRGAVTASQAALLQQDQQGAAAAGFSAAAAPLGAAQTNGSAAAAPAAAAGGRLVLLSAGDERVRRVPFATRRPTLKEAQRVAALLARVEVEEGGGEGGKEGATEGQGHTSGVSCVTEAGRDGGWGSRAAEGEGRGAAAEDTREETAGGKGRREEARAEQGPASRGAGSAADKACGGGTVNREKTEADEEQQEGSEGESEVDADGDVGEEEEEAGGGLQGTGRSSALHVAAAAGLRSRAAVLQSLLPSLSIVQWAWHAASTAMPPAPPTSSCAAAGDAAEVARLLAAGADPTQRDARGRVPYRLAVKKEVRDAMRRFMASHVDAWDWRAAGVPSALTEEMEAAQAAKQAEKDAKKKVKDKERKAKKKAAERAKKLEEQRQQQSMAASPPVPPSLSERELRAAAAERRLQQLSLQSSGRPTALPGDRGAGDGSAAAIRPGSAVTTRSDGPVQGAPPGGQGAASGAAQQSSGEAAGGAAAQGRACQVCGAALAGKTPFYRLAFAYCSTTCVRVHQAVMEERG